MSLTRLLFSILLLEFSSSAAPPSPPSSSEYNFDNSINKCHKLIERSEESIILAYQEGARNFDCTKLVKSQKADISKYPQYGFYNANLSGASFKGSDLSNSVWDETVVLGANFDYANLKNSNFAVNASKNESNLATSFIGTKFNCAKLYGTFTYANFQDADFTCNNGSITRINQANFSYANLNGTKFSDNTWFPSSGDLLCIEMAPSDISSLTQAGYASQAPLVRAGQSACNN